MWPEVQRARSENRHELVLGGNEIAERIAKEGLDPGIFALTGLNYLDLHETSLGAIPDEIARLVNLQSLVLHSNKLEGVNSAVTKLEKLKLLDLARNQLREVPPEIDKLANIVTFNFTFNCLGGFPELRNTRKLSVLDLSNNKLKIFPRVCNEGLANLSELKLSENEIETIPPEINQLTGLKVLELGHNKIKSLPGELADCTKLKVLGLKNNPISDRRLLKLIDQCRTKQIIDYVKAHSPKTVVQKSEQKGPPRATQDSDSDPDEYKHTIRVHYAKDSPKIVLDESVKSVREFLVACLVSVTFTEETFKKFIQIQNKLHETVCSKRNSSTIATHDYDKLPPGDLHYTTLPPSELQIQPLNRPTAMSGADLFTKLQTEANNLRKEKKRNTYSGIHKFLYLIEGKSRYPCLVNSQGIVVSFPPITNSEVTKIEVGTKNLLVEVTSSVSLHLCKVAMEALLRELIGLVGHDLEVTQVKSTDPDGNLRVVYPSKNDLVFEGNEIRVVRD
ncbi:leucine-rich repeat-containing protein 47 [Tribolium castaneum]|uniref:Leucine-rich repeat-containing protein 47-like Protein n=1 Tax=Tribolium castaneum TaxID=7070 RepID=D2A5G5_TRICA|nr:PREDICTED: leucine-rich repeat-containing protein 47 [Tribolium castaneum]EFA05368.1 Leucine-rich repeat-containing protein 47-like Protein [Tribolium castaneum]|eukprot:XP_967087.1 PREDICTED: leucine-rich repeat-containing protein 47 [Tribolium castaneum]